MITKKAEAVLWGLIVATTFLLCLFLTVCEGWAGALTVEWEDGSTTRFENVVNFTIHAPGEKELNIVPLDTADEMIYTIPGAGLWAIDCEVRPAEKE